MQLTLVQYLLASPASAVGFAAVLLSATDVLALLMSM